MSKKLRVINLRLIKLLNIILIVACFAGVWYRYYGDTIVSPYFGKGNIGVIFIYALLWQQVLKRFELTVAIANKSVTIIWGMIFGLVIFGEGITVKMIIGTVLILSGIMVLSSESKQ